MFGAISSYIGSFPDTRWNNIALFSIPVVNIVRRYLVEKKWAENAGAGLPDIKGLASANAKRASFQWDFVTGMVVQGAVCAFFLFKMLPLQPGKHSGFVLLGFAIFGINAGISLPYHFIEGNVTAGTGSL